MQELIQRILDEGEHVGGGIVKVDSFLNHQVDPQLTWRMAKAMHMVLWPKTCAELPEC